MTMTLTQRANRMLEYAEFYGWTEAPAPITRYFRKGRGKDASLYAVPNWNPSFSRPWVSVMFQGLYGDYWYEYADVTVLEKMQEVTEEEMRKIKPGLVEAALSSLLEDGSYLKFLLEWLGSLHEVLHHE